MSCVNYIILLFCISNEILKSNSYDYESTLYPKVEYFHPPEGYQPVKGYEPLNYQPNRKKIGVVQEKTKQWNLNQSPNPTYFNPFNLNSQQIYQQVYNNQYPSQQNQFSSQSTNFQTQNYQTNNYQSRKNDIQPTYPSFNFNNNNNNNNYPQNTYQPVNSQMNNRNNIITSVFSNQNNNNNNNQFNNFPTPTVNQFPNQNQNQNNNFNNQLNNWNRDNSPMSSISSFSLPNTPTNKFPISPSLPVSSVAEIDGWRRTPPSINLN